MYSNITLSDLVSWTGGKLSAGADPHLFISAISTDSRTLNKGEVFAALKGENFDGHLYLSQAADKGASVLISEKTVNVACPVLLVDQTLNALVQIGKGLRGRFHGPVFAVTGSAGKSSTRDMIAVLLGSGTLKAPASFNNLLGVSKTLFLLNESHKRLVLEMGMNAPNEIREMCERFGPTHGLITNIGDAHIGKLGGKEGIYQAKKELFDYLARNSSKGGVAVNVDDPLVEKAFRESLCGTLTSVSYSAEGKKADVRVLSRSVDASSGHLVLRLNLGGRIADVSCPVFGIHQAQNIAAAVAVAYLLQIPVEDVFSRLGSIRSAEHRGVILNLPQGVTCIDESYNSNPSALKSSLNSLSYFNAKRRRFLVIGEMRELGEFSRALHEECGNYLALSQSNQEVRLMTVGSEAKVLGEAAARTLKQVFHVKDDAEAFSMVEKMLQKNDLLFIKGSHGVRLDRLVEKLTHSVTKKP